MHALSYGHIHPTSSSSLHLMYVHDEQEDLVKDKAFLNFIRHLNWNEISARQRVLAAFVLTSIMDGYRLGQEACLHHLLADECCKLLERADEV